MRFGEKLRDLRKGKDMTQTDLAKEIGVSLRTIISYENSNSYPKKREVYSKLAAFFNIDINYLLTEDEEFITKAKDKYGNRGAKQAEDLVAEIGGLNTLDIFHSEDNHFTSLRLRRLVSSVFIYNIICNLIISN